MNVFISKNVLRGYYNGLKLTNLYMINKFVQVQSIAPAKPEYAKKNDISQ